MHKAHTELKPSIPHSDGFGANDDKATAHAYWANDDYEHGLELLKDFAIICDPDKITKFGRLVTPVPIPVQRLATELKFFPILTELSLFKTTRGAPGVCMPKE
jgi:hypothetical protein